MLLVAAAQAGLAPPDVLVLYNGSDPDGERVAREYQAARELQDRQLCPVASDLDPTTTTVAWDDFDASIRAPFEACLAAQPDPDEIDVLVLVRGLPYVVYLPTFSASVSAALQVGRAWTGGQDLAGQGQATSGSTAYASVENPVFLGDYNGSVEADFLVGRDYRRLYTATLKLVYRDKWPGSFSRATAGKGSAIDFDGELFLVTRLDGFDHDDASDLVARGLEADGTFPSAEILCMYGADQARGARDDECELVTRLLADSHNATWLDSFDSTLEGHEVAAYWTGAASMTGAIDGQSYVPGAIVDNITSYGAHPNNFVCSAEGDCPASEVQTSIARFVRAGATGVHGTVQEPLNNCFPHASTLLLYAHGYSLGESFLYSQPYTYWQNLVLGDPLAVPFGERPTLSVDERGGIATITADHPDGIASIKVFRDGVVIAQAAGASLELVLEEPAGASVPLFLVAYSGHLEVGSAWPDGPVTARPEVAGWSAVEVLVGEAEDTGDTAEGGLAPVDPPKDCQGCATAPLGFSWLVLFAIRRRR